MFLDDLLDDREPEPGPPHPRRHIRFRQPLAVLGEPDAGIDNVDHQLVVFAVELQLNTIAGEAVFAAVSPCLNRFDAVLDVICRRLGKLPAVTDQAARRWSDNWSLMSSNVSTDPSP